MAQFNYRALSGNGQIITGSITAASRPEAVSQLRQQGVRPLHLDESQTSGAKTAVEGSISKRRARVSRRDIQVFTAQLSALLKAGIILSQALAILEEQTENASFAAIIKMIHKDITDGISLSEAFEKHPRQFSRLYCSMVRVGESGGVLDVVLKQLAGFMEAENALRSNVATAMAYPMLVVVVGIGSILLLVTFVIPRLGAVFADFGNNLPFLTRILINGSDFFLAYWWLFLVVLISVMYGFRQLLKNPDFSDKFDAFKEKIPALGQVIVKSQIARFSRTMGTLIKSGIPVLNALNLVVDTTTSRALARSLRDVSDKVKKGEGLARPLRETGFFPPMVTNLIAVGEESGTLDDMLFQVAETYDQEVQHAIKRFITLFEPLVIILMAIGVGGILFAFLLPILNIGQMVS
ncbi:MAG: type II secretion system F family protein [bacterium]|jgi:general secretion pathway protein F